MFQILQILSIAFAAIGMSLTLAHVLELPGKLRLDREAYLAVQTIYYPPSPSAGQGQSSPRACSC